MYLFLNVLAIHAAHMPVQPQRSAHIDPSVTCEVILRACQPCRLCDMMALCGSRGPEKCERSQVFLLMHVMAARGHIVCLRTSGPCVGPSGQSTCLCDSRSISSIAHVSSIDVFSALLVRTATRTPALPAAVALFFITVVLSRIGLVPVTARMAQRAEPTPPKRPLGAYFLWCLCTNGMSC